MLLITGRLYQAVIKFSGRVTPTGKLSCSGKGRLQPVHAQEPSGCWAAGELWPLDVPAASNIIAKGAAALLYK